MKTTHFILHDNYITKFNKLPMEERGQVITAIFCYRNGEELPTMSLASEMLFEFIREQLDRDNQKYIETCEKRAKGGVLGAEYGKLGGRPSKSYDEILTEYTLSESIKTKVFDVVKQNISNGEKLTTPQLKKILDVCQSSSEDNALIYLDSLLKTP